MGRACSICQRTDRDAVDAALVDGVGLVVLAASTGTSKSALSRHRNACLAPRMRAAGRITNAGPERRRAVRRANEIAAGAEPTPEERVDLEGLTRRVTRNLRRLEAAAEEAHAGGAYNQLAALSAQLTRSVEALARLQGVGAQPDSGDKFSVRIEISRPEIVPPSPAALPVAFEGPAPTDPGFTLRLPFRA